MSKVPTRRLDVLFIEPDSAGVAYQDLSKVYSAIETPTWSLLLAQSCRAKGYGVGILDQTAQRLSDVQALQRIGEENPRLAVFVVYGQNPNSGTTNMIGAERLCSALKLAYPEIKTCFVGSHTSALPREVLAMPCVDFVLLNEGVYALHNLLTTNLEDKISAVKGLGHKTGGQLTLNDPQAVVPQERMDHDLPGYAWDLLPYDQKPLDLYRAHFWHAEFSHEKRTPFAAIYTSLGCRFACDFCMINIVNRVDNTEGVVSANSRNMRYWSPDFITKEFEKLAAYGVETIRISDEMFFLDKRYYEPLCQNIIDRGLKFRMWSYSRVDTVRKEFLDLFSERELVGWPLGLKRATKRCARRCLRALSRTSIFGRLSARFGIRVSTLFPTTSLGFRMTAARRCNRPSIWPSNFARRWSTCIPAKPFQEVLSTILPGRWVGSCRISRKALLFCLMNLCLYRQNMSPLQKCCVFGIMPGKPILLIGLFSI